MCHELKYLHTLTRPPPSHYSQNTPHSLSFSPCTVTSSCFWWENPYLQLKSWYRWRCVQLILWYGESENPNSGTLRSMSPPWSPMFMVDDSFGADEADSSSSVRRQMPSSLCADSDPSSSPNHSPLALQSHMQMLPFPFSGNSSSWHMSVLGALKCPTSSWCRAPIVSLLADCISYPTLTYDPTPSMPPFLRIPYSMTNTDTASVEKHKELIEAFFDDPVPTLLGIDEYLTLANLYYCLFVWT